MTGVLARLQLDTGELTWSNAGHPVPLLLRNRKVLGPLAYEPAPPFGLDGDGCHTQVEALEPGDTLLLYTDGVIEARTSGGTEFGLDRLADLLEREAAAETTPEETVRRLVRSILEHQGDGDLRDDATLALLHWSGPPVTLPKSGPRVGVAEGGVAGTRPRWHDEPGPLHRQRITTGLLREPSAPRVGAPPPLAKGGLRVVALGGLGEIGRNMTVFEHAGKLLIVDCGVLFPEETQPGVDVILPDFTWIRDRLAKVVAIVLTHGHEDHIGGVPYLLRERADIPVIGSKLTLAFIDAKLNEHRITPMTVEVAEGHRQKFGPFDFEFVAVNHSIPDGLAVAIRTAAGLVLHTGDFKMDQFPLDKRITDLRAFARLGEEGVDLFLTDSTNAEVPGFTTSERDLVPAIEEVFRTAPRRVIVSSFASHVHRIQQVLDAAHDHGRKVAFVGRSMVRNMGIARDLGYLKVPKGLVVDLKALEKLADDKVTLVCTGSQGEPMAALSRMANRDHMIRIGKGDTVLLASSLIPATRTPSTG